MAISISIAIAMMRREYCTGNFLSVDYEMVWFGSVLFIAYFGRLHCIPFHSIPLALFVGCKFSTNTVWFGINSN